MGIVEPSEKRNFAAEIIIVQTMGLLSKLFSNAKKPEGFLGKMMVNGMNGGGHAAGFSDINIQKDESKHWLMATAIK